MTYYKFVNNEMVVMTDEEVAKLEARLSANAAIEKSRPLTSNEVIDMLIKSQVNSLDVDDSTALRMKTFYPTWAELCEKGSVVTDKTGYKFTHDGKLYACLSVNPTFSSAWVPGVGTESLYTVINETNDGTIEDPIPYGGNMALENGKYYIQNGHVYLCNRDTGTPVYNTLRDLVGLYVQVVA